MPRPRFEKLSAEKQEAILSAAATEFSANGYQGASYNQIIEKTGISKGAMYYYFDDKADLFAAVVRKTFDSFMAACGATAKPASTDAFWQTLRDLHDRGLRWAHKHPTALGVVRALQRAKAAGLHHPAIQETTERSLIWTRDLLRQGQEVGAIRTDLPFDLLLSFVSALDEAGDRWFSENWEHYTFDDLERLGDILFEMMRQMLSPPDRRKR